jgi:hypothetical protein
MLRMLVLSIVALAVAACAPAPPMGGLATKLDDGKPFIGINGKPLVSPEGIMDNAVAQALTDDPAACAKAGGTIRKVCMMGNPLCVVTFKDAGEACSDGSECDSGRCRTSDMGMQPEKATKGVCAPTNDPCGCFQAVEDGKAGYPLCAD